MTIAQKNNSYTLLIKDYKSIVDEIQKAYAICDLLGTTMCIYTLRDFNKRLAMIDTIISKVEETETTSETNPKN